MRVSLDLDDTLVCGSDVPLDPPLAWWWRWVYPERVRQGTRGLLADLEARGCRIWVYTTSYRSARYIRGWFRRLGVRLDGVVNQPMHDRVVGRHGPSKLPSAFQIALHVDDSDGVRAEGDRHGFTVVVVSPDDPNWAHRVLAAVDGRRGGRT
ncbi:MAG: hypothetical protein U0794_20855 [Isosphaeraceae bacterium]